MSAPSSRRFSVGSCLRCADVGAWEPSVSDTKSPLGTLSSREFEILRLASTGSTNPAIGAELGLSVHAVKFHLASVYRKLGVSNRTEAAVVLMAKSGDGGSRIADIQIGKEQAG